MYKNLFTYFLWQIFYLSIPYKNKGKRKLSSNETYEKKDEAQQLDKYMSRKVLLTKQGDIERQG